MYIFGVDIPVVEVIFAVGYLAELIMAYFGTGDKWDVEISYSRETKNLGTIGPLSLIENLENEFLVMNGDILTDLNFKDFFTKSLPPDSYVTIASYCKQVKIDLGILETNDENLLFVTLEEIYKIDEIITLDIDLDEVKYRQETHTLRDHIKHYLEKKRSH